MSAAGFLLADVAAVAGAALAAAVTVSKRAARPLDRRPWAGAIAVAAVALGVSAGLGILHPAFPTIHDEFSYLLAADTYAHFRVANPSPPLREHFETFHTLTSPAYASKYPPGQGLALALGLLLFNSAAAGAWLAFAAACVAILWALRAALPARFALATALAAALFPPFHDNGMYAWTQTYWGGQVALLGGALLFGSVFRLSRRATRTAALALGAGLGVLAMSRPFEGLVAAALAAAMLAVAWRRSGLPRGLAAAAPWAAAALVPAAVFLLFVNARVTGHPLRFPYQEYEAQYASIPPAYWLGAPEVKGYSSADLAAFYAEDRRKWEAGRSVRGYARVLRDRFEEVAIFFGKPLGVAWLGLPLALGRRRARRILFALAAAFAVALSMTWMFPHYLAPLVPLGAALAARSLRSLAALPPPWHRFGAAVVLCAFAPIAARLVSDAGGAARSNNPEAWPAVRDTVARRAAADSPRPLLLVERRGGWSPHQEWVFNAADLDAAPVVWARSLGPGPDRELLARFPDRTPWRVVLDAHGWSLERWK